MRAGAAPDDSVSHGFAEAIELLGPLGHNVVDGRLPFDGPDSIRVLNDITEGMFTRRLGAMCDLIGVQIAPEDLEHRSEEHTSELQSLMRISYAVFCLKKKNNNTTIQRYDLRNEASTKTTHNIPHNRRTMTNK